MNIEKIKKHIPVKIESINNLNKFCYPYLGKHWQIFITSKSKIFIIILDEKCIAYTNI